MKLGGQVGHGIQANRLDFGTDWDQFSYFLNIRLKEDY